MTAQEGTSRPPLAAAAASGARLRSTKQQPALRHPSREVQEKEHSANRWRRALLWRAPASTEERGRAQARLAALDGCGSLEK